MTITYNGQLEIDTDRGVIYFHDIQTGITMMRICSLPTPIPEDTQIDITFGYGCSWSDKICKPNDIQLALREVLQFIPQHYLCGIMEKHPVISKLQKGILNVR